MLVFLCCFACFAAFAQSNPLAKRATLQMQKEPLENVLASITKQTGVRFSYNSQIINPQTKITINVYNKTIKEILSNILPSSVSYKKVGEHIIFCAAILPKNNIAKTDSLVSNSFSEPLKEKQEKTEKNTVSYNGNPTDSCLSNVSAAKDTLRLTIDTVNLTKEEEMSINKTSVAATLVAMASLASPIAAQDTMPQGRETRDTTISQKTKPFQLTFIYPVGTGGTKSGENTYCVSFNVLGGVTGQVKGFEIGSLFNINKYGARGAQFAGIFNHTGANNPAISSANAQFAGVYNITQKGKSAQFAGVFSYGDTAYFQASGVSNIAKESKVQVAGVSNHGKTAIFQAAGVLNTAAKAYCQIAGVVNTSQESKCQIAGIVNAAQESKCQVAGIVNKTKKGRFQAGLINIRDTADGVSLGLINIVKKGGIMEAGIEAGEFVHTALTFRSGTQRLYSIVSVGYGFSKSYVSVIVNGKESYRKGFWAVGSGLGTSFKLVGKLGLNLEATYTSLYYKKLYPHYYSIYGSQWKGLTQISPTLNYRFAKHFKIYAGPSLNILTQRDEGIFNSYYLSDFPQEPPYSIYHRNYKHSSLDMWIGVVGGIKF